MLVTTDLRQNSSFAMLQSLKIAYESFWWNSVSIGSAALVDAGKKSGSLALER